MTRLLTALAITAIALSLGLTGCRAKAGVKVGGPKHKAVVVKKGHKHTDHCGHYHHKGKWHHHRGHVHKAGCGHRKQGGIWIWVG